MRHAKNRDQAMDMSIIGGPKPSHAHIQWKGTDVCMDVYCICGERGHVDGGFVYNVRCPCCGRVYFCNPMIELICLETEPETCVVEMEGTD